MLWRGFGGIVGDSPDYALSETITVWGEDLTTTYTESVASTFTSYTSTERGQNAVFSCDVLFSSSPADGQIFKMGSLGTGCWVGLRDGGTVFRVRAGDGVSLSGSTANAAVLDIADFPKDDQVHNVVWEFQTNPGRVRLWIDGMLKGEGLTTNGSSLGSGNWSGVNEGNYLATTNDGPTGEPSTVWSAGTSGASVLTFYGNQLVNSTENIIQTAQSGIWNLSSTYYNSIPLWRGSVNKFNLVGNPINIYGWVGRDGAITTGLNCNISRDSSVTDSPFGGIPMRMDITGDGNDPQVGTYSNIGGYTWNIASAVTGETWEMRVLVKAGQTGLVDGQFFIFGAGADGIWANTGGDISGGTVQFDTEWKEFKATFTINNSDVRYIQLRLDGPQTGGTGSSIWWDGLQVYKIS